MGSSFLSSFFGSVFFGNREQKRGSGGNCDRIMVRVPSDRVLIHGRTEQAKLAAKDRATRTATTLFFRAGGMITARNIPKRATLKALTTRSGKMLPAMMPRDVPMDQPGIAMSMAP